MFVKSIPWSGILFSGLEQPCGDIVLACGDTGDIVLGYGDTQTGWRYWELLLSGMWKCSAIVSDIERGSPPCLELLNTTLSILYPEMTN